MRNRYLSLAFVLASLLSPVAFADFKLLSTEEWRILEVNNNVPMNMTPGLAVLQSIRDPSQMFIGTLRDGVVSGYAMAVPSPSQQTQFNSNGGVVIEQWHWNMRLYPLAFAPLSNIAVLTQKLTSAAGPKEWLAAVANFAYENAQPIYALLHPAQPIQRAQPGTFSLNNQIQDQPIGVPRDDFTNYSEAPNYTSNGTPVGRFFSINKRTGQLMVGMNDGSGATKYSVTWPSTSPAAMYFIQNLCSGPISPILRKAVKTYATRYRDIPDKIQFARLLLSLKRHVGEEGEPLRLAGEFGPNGQQSSIEVRGSLEFGVPHGFASSYDASKKKLKVGMFLMGYPSEPMLTFNEENGALYMHKGKLPRELETKILGKLRESIAPLKQLGYRAVHEPLVRGMTQFFGSMAQQ